MLKGNLFCFVSVVPQMKPWPHTCWASVLLSYTPAFQFCLLSKDHNRKKQPLSIMFWFGVFNPDQPDRDKLTNKYVVSVLPKCAHTNKFHTALANSEFLLNTLVKTAHCFPKLHDEQHSRTVEAALQAPVLALLIPD